MKVTLLTDHEHAGISYAAGAVIDVHDSDLEFLMNIGACEIETIPAALAAADEPPLTVQEAAARTAKGRKG